MFAKEKEEEADDTSVRLEENSVAVLIWIFLRAKEEHVLQKVR